MRTLKTISIDELETITGGGKDYSTMPWTGSGGGWIQTRPKGLDVQTRWISPDGVKGKWESVGPD